MSEAPGRPAGLRLITWLLWFWAGAVALLLFGLVAGDGPVLLEGRAVARRAALERLLPVLLPMLLAAGGAALALTLQKAWARPAVLMPLALAGLAPAITGDVVSLPDLLRTSLPMVVVMTVGIWYFFFRAPVRRYFAALRARDRSAEP